MCSFGISSTCVGACGSMSRNASTSPVSSTLSQGISPFTILQNRQSAMTTLLAVQHLKRVAPAAALHAVQHPDHAHRFEVARALDAAEIRELPSEVLQDPGHGLL